MKRVLLVLLVAVLAFPTFQSCKKGENDPALSLKSRKARLVGEWTLEEGVLTRLVGGITQTATYDGSTCIFNPGGSVSYTEKVVIDKAGTFETTVLNDGDLTVTEGQWYFMEGNKDKEMKNKECVAFVNTKVTYTAAGDTPVISSYTSIQVDAVWQLDELKSKEIIIIFNEVATETSTSSITGTLTFSKN